MSVIDPLVELVGRCARFHERLGVCAGEQWQRGGPFIL